MVIKYKLPSNLQYGDAVELRGRAGEEKVIVEFLSDYLACDPGKENSTVRPDDPNVDVLPVVETQPLQIILETSGCWDVNAKSPIASTSSHGTTAKRFGFRPNEDFVCTVFVRPEHFEIRLNDIAFASSEHLVPVGEIHGILLDGDATVSEIRFGLPIVMQQYSQCHKDIPTHTENGIASIIECRMATDEKIQAAYRHDSALNVQTLNNDFSRSSFELYTPMEEFEKDQETILPGLHRATSYQLVFDLEDSDPDEKHDAEPISHDRRAKSQCNLYTTAPLPQEVDTKPNTKVNKSMSFKNNSPVVRNPVKRYSSSVARKASARMDENRLSSQNKREDVSGTPNVVSRPRFNPQVSNRPVKRLPAVPDSSTNSKSSNDATTPNRSVLYLSDGTTQVKSRQSYQPLLPYEAKQLEKLLDEDTTVSVSNQHVLNRGRSQTMYNPYQRTSSNQPFYEPSNRQFRPNRFQMDENLARRASYNPRFGADSTVLLRSPLTLLDEQWDKVLPHAPATIRFGGTSDMPSKDTLSSNSEENRPPLVHWYTQMKQKSRPVSMLVCGNSGLLPLTESSQNPLNSDTSFPPRLSKLMKSQEKSKLPVFPVVTNDISPPSQPPFGKSDSNQFHNGTNNLSATNMKGSKLNANFSSDDKRNGQNISQLNSTISGDAKFDNPDEPVLLIDCIPMDDNICVVQQPIETWPPKMSLPVMLPVPNSWNDQLNIPHEPHTFDRVRNDLPDADFLGDNTASLLSEMTMRSECADIGATSDEFEDDPGYSVHDPRSPEDKTTDKQSNVMLHHDLLQTYDPSSFNKSKTQNGLTQNNSAPSADFSLTYKEPQTAEYAPITRNSSNPAQIPRSTSNSKDLRRAILEKNLVAELPEKITPDKRSETIVETDANENDTRKVEGKQTDVPRMLQNPQVGSSTFNGTLSQKSEPVKTGFQDLQKPTTAQDQIPTNSVNKFVANGHSNSNGTKPDNLTSKTNSNDKLKQFVQSPKKWFSKRLKKVKM